jgi:hypothetical protein
VQHSVCAAQLHSRTVAQPHIRWLTPRHGSIAGTKEAKVSNNMGAAALVIVGVVLVFLGIFGGNLPVIVIGVVALIAAGTLQAIATRRG